MRRLQDHIKNTNMLALMQAVIDDQPGDLRDILHFMLKELDNYEEELAEHARMLEEQWRNGE